MSSSSQKGAALIKWGAAFSVTGALTVLLSGYGYQWCWWHYSFGFNLAPWGTGITILGGILAGVGIYRMKEKLRTFTLMGITGILLAIIAIVNAGYWYYEIQKGYPPIHDISTDTENPPQFAAIVPLRKDAPNPAEYAGEETAAFQKEFYPDIETLTVNYDFDETYDRALMAAREMRWILVGESREEGRIEAYEKLAWFGFIDDVVIRVDTVAAGSEIDVRSKSRIGRGDLGVNAKRIRVYLAEFLK